MQHQPGPATPGARVKREEGGDEHEEEQRRRAASRQMGEPALGGRNEGFRGSVFDPSKLSRNASEGDGDELNSPRDGGRKRQTYSQGRRCGSLQIPYPSPFLFQQQQQQLHGDGLP